MHGNLKRRGTMSGALLLFLAAIVIPFASAHAQDPQGGLPGDWLSEYSGARATGLGGAFVAEASGPMGSMWNPTSVTRPMQNEVHFEQMRLFEGTTLNGFGIAVPNRTLPSIGFTVLTLSSGEFERTNELNESLGQFDQSNSAFLLTLAKQINPRLSVGTNFKIVRESIEEFSATGFGVDIGARYRAHRLVSLGASLLNMGGPTVSMREVDEDFPVEFRGGFGLHVLDGRAVLLGEIKNRSGMDATFHTGSEFWLNRNIALRLGYDQNNPAGGFTYQTPGGMAFTYAAADHELGVTHRFGISFSFGGFFADTGAQPSVFSPTGRNSVTKFNIESHLRSDPESWELHIVNGSDEVVRRFGGKGQPPSHVTWDGKDENGLPLPDGAYSYELVVHDADGRQMNSQMRVVEILTDGPRGQVPVNTR